MENLLKEYRDLELRVLRELRNKVEKSEYKSKFTNDMAIIVDIEHYCELAIVNDRLEFFDNNGLQYSLFNISLEDIIMLLNKI